MGAYTTPSRNTCRPTCDDILFFILVLIFFLLLFAFEIFLIIPVPSPGFTLHAAKLYAFNVSTATSTLTTNLQITISSQNTKRDPGFQFEKIDVYASYQSQQITPSTTIFPRYLHSPEVALWSRYLNGTNVPVEPYLAESMAQDEAVGTVLIDVKVEGQLRLHSVFGTSRYRLKVNCPAYITFGSKNDTMGSAEKHPYLEGCHVKVYNTNAKMFRKDYFSKPYVVDPMW